jgi:ATP-dependent Clp protease ATP-binding subunit ClpA
MSSMLSFNIQASMVFHFAREEALRLGHAEVAPEHLLLGVLRTEDEASQVLSEFGVNLEAVRAQLAVIEDRTPPKGEAVTVSPGAQAVMELAGSEAQDLRTNRIYTAHILLGVLHSNSFQEQGGTVRQVLEALVDKKSVGEHDGFPLFRQHLVNLAQQQANKP